MRKLLTKLSILSLAIATMFVVAQANTFAQTTKYKTTRTTTKSYDYLDDDFYNDDFANSANPMTPEDSAEALAIFSGAMLVIMLIVFTPIYIYMAITHRKMAEKIHYKHPNWFWVPVLNMVATFQMGDTSPWYLALLLTGLLIVVPLIGFVLFFIASIIFVVFLIKAYMNIAEKLGFPRWTGILVIISPINLIIWGLWAWGDPQKLFASSSTTTTTNPSTSTPTSTDK